MPSNTKHNRDRTLQALLAAATELTAGLASEARYQNLVKVVRSVVPCDAAALLRLEGEELVPIATVGLSAEVLGRRFPLGSNPRFKAILEAGRPLRFPKDDPAPDPFDGLIPGGAPGVLAVHSCMGAALRVEGELVGALTVDALQPDRFDGVDDDHFALFAALAAASLRTVGLIESLERLAERRGLVAEALVAEQLHSQGGRILGQSDAMLALRQEIRTVASSDLCVLIQGETGTGKELVARSIHAGSARAHQPLVYVNCAAVPESIAESELFGHVKGAFTGAVAGRAGKFELADGGTLFLDEVGELPLSIQPKLLRVLQFGEVQRVGQDRPQRVDVRILAATNRDLAEEVRAGRFRADLYHRLAVFPVKVPPLRLREGDIPVLANHFLDRAVAKLGTGRAVLSPAALDLLDRYPWPGNVRELEHLILRALLRASSQVPKAEPLVLEPGLLDLGQAEVAPRSHAGDQEICVPLGLSLGEAVDRFKADYLRRHLEVCGGRWSQVAQTLGLDRGNLFRLRRRLGLNQPGQR